MAALPAIFPVNYALLDGEIVFMTGEGTKLRAALERAVVAFQVDHIDEADAAGWSVMAARIRPSATRAARVAKASRPLSLSMISVESSSVGAGRRPGTSP